MNSRKLGVEELINCSRRRVTGLNGVNHDQASHAQCAIQ